MINLNQISKRLRVTMKKDLVVEQYKYLQIRSKAWLFALYLKLLTRYEYFRLTQLINGDVKQTLREYLGQLGGQYRYFTQFVLLPFLLISFYIIFLMSGQYQSTAQLVIKENGGTSSPSISLGFLGGISGGQESQNAYMLQSFIQSRGMLELLNQQLNIKNYFQSHSIDWFSRLSSRSNDEDFLKYYNQMVSVEYDSMSSTVNVGALAFDPHYSKKFLETILEKSQQFVNRVSHSLAIQQLDFAQKQLASAKKKFHTAENTVLTFQNQYKLFDPAREGATASSVMSELQAQLIKEQTKLINYKSYLQPNASQVVTSEQQIEAIKQQIINQTKTYIGQQSQDTKLNNILAQFAWIKLEAEFAQAELKASQEAEEMAKISLSKEQNAMIVIVKPNLPDDYAYPRKLYDIFTLFILLGVLYMIGKMIIIIIQEHRD